MEGLGDRDVEDFIAHARVAVIAQQPAQQHYFDICANEALFGFSIIKKDIVILPQDAIVLEVGAGILLLSGYLASLGLRVHGTLINNEADCREEREYEDPY